MSTVRVRIFVRRLLPFSVFICASLALLVLATRDGSVSAPNPSTGHAGARAQLARRLPEISFNGHRLADVVLFFNDLSGARIEVKWDALEAEGVTRDSPVVARLKDCRFSKCLATVLNDVGARRARLTYYASPDGTWVITTRADYVARYTVCRVYDVRDLLLYDAVPQTRAERNDALLALIRDTIDPTAWRESGGPFTITA